jgi:glycine betaine/proline transport system ATP-binding protein
VTELYVVGPGRRLLGVVRDRDLAEATQRGDSTVDRAIHDNFPRTDPETPIADLFALSAEHTIPLAVVNGTGSLLGVVPRVSLLDALSGPDGRRNDA